MTKARKTILATLALIALVAQSALAGEVASETVGFKRGVVPANTDYHLSLPYTRQVEGTYTVSSVASPSINIAETITANQFGGGAFYVRFISGNGEGLWSTISSNTAGAITLSTPAVLAHVSAGDKVRVYRHHTLGTVFPKWLYGQTYNTSTQVLIWENNISAMAQNRSASKTATYSTSGGGRWVGAGVSNNTILPPETKIVVRNGGASSIAVFTVGRMPDYSVAMLVAPNGDLYIGSGYATPVTLKYSGLGGVANRQVMFFDNAATGINKSASKTASYSLSGGGRWIGAGVTGNELIKDSESVTFRLPVVDPGTKVRINKPL